MGRDNLTGSAAFQAAEDGLTGTAAKMAAIPVSAAKMAAGDGLTGSAAFQAAESAQAVVFPDAISDAQSHFASCFDTVAVTRHNLPHWGLDGAVVFVTFRLADSLPASLLAEWQEEKNAWLARHPEPWTSEEEREYSTIFSNRMEQWLDKGHGACILARQDCRKVVSDALEHFNGMRYRLHSYVVMPNHVHVLLDLPKRDDLSRVLHSWKSFTAKALNKLNGAVGTVWMRDYYDRIVRNGEHYGRCLAYIRKNAMSAAKMAAFPVSAAAKMAAFPVRSERA